MSRKTGMSSSPATMKINGSLAGGGAAEKAAIMFRKHDQNQVSVSGRGPDRDSRG